MSEHTTLITGASVGIGRASAELLARNGHHVVGMSRREADDFPGTYIQVDLMDEQATADALKKAAGEFEFDGLINNVGIVRPAPLEDVTIEDLMDVYTLNVARAVQCAQALIPSMLKKNYGRIVNVASLVTAGVPHRTSYAASKCALVSCTASWALEYTSKRITVNAVSPGPTATEMFNTHNPPGSPGYKRYVGMTPMKRVASPEEVAVAIAFFMSEEAAFITGQNLYVDGGASVGPAPEK